MAEARVDVKGLDSLIECAICLGNVTNHRVLPCQHLFCQICLEPMVTDGSISCPVCRRTCNLGGLPVDSLPRNLLLMALLDQLCELCKTRNRVLKCTHCEKWTCKVCHQKCHDEMIRTLHKLKSETTELKTAGNSRRGLLFQDTVRIYEAIAEASKRIDQNLEMSIKRATKEHQEQKAELQVWGKLELEQLQSCYQESAANLIKLEEFEQKYSDLIGSDVNQSKDMSSICKDWESCICSARDSDSARPNVRAHFKIEDFDVGHIHGCGNIHKERATDSRDPGGPAHNQTGRMMPSATGPNKLSLPGVPNGEATTPKNEPFNASALAEPWEDLDTGLDSEQGISAYDVGTGMTPVVGSTTDQSIEKGAIADITHTDNAPQVEHPLNVVSKPRSYSLSYESLSTPRLTVGLKGTGPNNFDCPSFVSVSSVTNKIYISDTENNRIQVLNEHGEFSSRFGSRGTSRAKFTLCDDYMAGGVHIACANRNRLLITDSGNNRIKIYNGDFKVIDVFGEEGSSRGQLSNPLGVTTDRRGHIYVSEAGNQRIQVFDASGTSLRVFGTRLDWVPCGIAMCPNGNIVVADRGDDGDNNGQIEIFFNNGQNIRTIDQVGSSLLKSPRDVAVDREGNMIVTDAEAHKVYIIRDNGELIKTLGCHGNEPGQFKYPSGVACLEDGGLIVVDQGNHRVQIF